MTDSSTSTSIDTSPLKILGIVDLHWNGKREPHLPDTEAFDLVLVAGDLTNFLGRDAARTIVDGLRASGTPVFAVCGNCDQPEIEEELDQLGIGLDRRAVVHRGICLTGLSGGLPFGDLPYERTEEQYGRACAAMWQAVDQADPGGDLPVIVVSHQPAHGTECDLARGNHVGSTSIRRSLEERQPDLVFSGHIHESVGEGTLGRTRLVNPGPWFERRYVEIEVHPNAAPGERIQLDVRQADR